MKNSDLAELVSLSIHFISTLIAFIFSSIVIIYVNIILFDYNYKFYLSDYKSIYSPISNISWELTNYTFSTEYKEVRFNSLYTYSDQLSEFDILNFFEIANHILVIQFDPLYYGEKKSFKIIEVTDDCKSYGLLDCYSNTHYKTCGLRYCPITFITPKDTEEFLQEEYEFFPFLTTFNSTKREMIQNKTLGLETFNIYSKSYYFSRNVTGVPIIYIEGLNDKPCWLHYIIKSQLIMNMINHSQNKIDCWIFEYLLDNNYKDSENDLDVGNYYTLDSIRNTDDISQENLYDNRTLLLFKDTLTFNLGNNNSSIVLDLMTQIVIRKLQYATREDCEAKLYSINTMFDIFYIAQLRVVNLRFASWSLVEIIYMAFFYGYIKGYFLFTKLKDISEQKIRHVESETRTVTFFLHYFIIVVRVFSIIIATSYVKGNGLPESTDYYKDCVSDELLIEAYNHTHLNFVEVQRFLNLIMWLTIMSSLIDFCVRIIVMLMKKFNRIKKKEI